MKRIAILVTLTFVAACGSKNNGPNGPSPLPEPNSTIRYTAIGASDAIGYGASTFCLPYEECPNGKGYVHVAARDLRSRGFTVNLNNLGLPGSVLSRRIMNLGRQYGRDDLITNFEDQMFPFVRADSTLVTIFAGGNDVNAITGALGRGAGGADNTGFINGQITSFGQEFAAGLQRIRERAPSARIIVLNLPNMGGMPFLAGATRDQRLAAQMLSVGITRTVYNPLTASGVLVIDLMCDPRSYQASTYSADGFHPNDTGYAWIAAEVVSATLTAYRAPVASCAQMSVVQ